ncbi:NADPH-dependent ferric siderophore reductase, contains FAD-binding and SIP domains [Saccharopolyspora kobensis]|uniref:NADPH-dependent ferric siderophore reductase, contains FAD-binding and SIP domains n=1 Tax=Saccharopolyspora kobensis TaxID=146035 RepID=A0A1H6E5E8_9PSEU|nr:NADPH-dependent ferric siderophore reductase, contains FAD-binding and SIP domains [Saccharopolyspora kobensis]SFD35874.1 NADPH-dependent ferric siderophore reductase, contains FAD-binding and SIP domains [Saccharopolyspora kobensis]
MGTADRLRHSRPPARDLQVLRTAELSPSMRRITLGGEELEGFLDQHTGPNIKVFVPQQGQQRPVLPELDDETGRYRWPELHERPTMRTYTVRRYDEARGELDVDFVMHGAHGVASNWARNARPGDHLGVMGPGGKTCRAADYYLLVGDETALPAISSIVEGLPPTARGQVLVEIGDAAEQQHVQCPPDLEWTWLHREGVAAGRSQLLVDAVQQLDVPVDVDVSAWVAGESGIVRGIRRHLRNDRGMDAKSVLAIGYWKYGLAETEYHDKHNHDRD